MFKLPECKGCQISTGLTEVEGGAISLGSSWIVNHYQNKEERFLGWLVVQPIQHRTKSSEMTMHELEEFGIVTQRLESALTTAYNTLYVDDKVEIAYVVRLGESTLARRAEWHLHWHVVPRTASMKRKCDGWDIVKCREKGVKAAPTMKQIGELMNGIRHALTI